MSINITGEDRHDADGKAYIAYFLTDPMMHFIWSGNHNEPVQVTRGESGEPITETFLVPPAALSIAWDKAFAALKAAGLEAVDDDPIAATYRDASVAVNHANRKWESSTFNVLREFRLACDEYARTTCDGCDQDPWREPVHYGTCPLAPKLECLDRHDGECEGPVEYRHPLSGTGKPFPRCDHHWDKRLDVQAGINRRYPDQATPPSDFDPSFAGESWDGE